MKRWIGFLLAFCLFTPLVAAPDALVIILLGPPGSGKTTQAKYLSRTYKIPAVSAAELLKKGRGRGRKMTRQQRAAYESGELVNDQTMNQLMLFRLEKPDALRGFVLDGYPAAGGQAEFLGELLKKRGLPEPIVIHLEVPDRIAKERMDRRGRADDQPAIIERRLSNYHLERDFVLGYYPQNRLFRVDGTQSEKDVSQAIGKALASRGAGLLK